MQPRERAETGVVVAGLASLTTLSLGLTGSAAAALTILGLCAALVAGSAVGAGGPTPRALWPLVGALTAVALIRPSIGSQDLWSYAMYGRMVSHYGVSPYTSVAASYPHDLVYPLVGWRHTSSVYGPLFTLYSALASRFAGSSLLVLRLAFQGLAAASVVWCLRTLDRAGRAATLTILALQPFVWVSVVNGGHNDAFVAAVLLGAVLTFRRDRIAASSALLALALLVKLSAAFAAVPLVVILARRGRWREVAVMVGGVVGALGMTAAVSPRALGNASAATRSIVSRTSVWAPWRALSGVSAPTVSLLATLVIGVAIAAVAWRHRADADPSLGAGSSMSVFGLAASYTLPWYLLWGLPLLALSGDVAATMIVAARGSLMQATYQLGPGRLLDVPRLMGSTVAPLGLLLAFAWVLRGASTPGAPEPAEVPEAVVV